MQIRHARPARSLLSYGLYRITAEKRTTHTYNRLHPTRISVPLMQELSVIIVCAGG